MTSPTTLEKAPKAAESTSFPTITYNGLGYYAYVIVDNGTRVIRAGWRITSTAAMKLAVEKQKSIAEAELL